MQAGVDGGSLLGLSFLVSYLRHHLPLKLLLVGLSVEANFRTPALRRRRARRRRFTIEVLNMLTILLRIDFPLLSLYSGQVALIWCSLCICELFNFASQAGIQVERLDRRLRTMLFPATEASRPLSLLNKMKRPKRRRASTSGLLLLLHCRKLPLI